MDKLKKFYEKIGYKPTTSFKEVVLVKKEIKKVNNEILLFLNLEIENFLPLFEIKKFDEAIKNFKNKIVVSFDVKDKKHKIDELLSYLEYITSDLDKIISKNLDANDFKVINKVLKINTWNDSITSFYWQNQKVIIKKLINYGFDITKIEIKRGYRSNINLDEHKLRTRAKEVSLKIEKTKQIDASFNQKGFKKVELDKLTKFDENKKVSFIAKAILVEKSQTKSGLLYSYVFTNFKNSLYCIYFSWYSKASLETIEIGKVYEVYGRPKLSKNSLDIYLDGVILVDDPFISKEEEIKTSRVELHTHSKMSPLDGVPDVEELLQKAIDFKHKAIGITDHNSVQSYPSINNFLKSKKNNSLKVLYGIEADLINEIDAEIVVNNKKDLSFENQEIIFFDIETTGLSSVYNEIIEFGAIKYKNQMVVEQKSFFVKPKKKIPEHITNITGITNEMVKDAKPIKDYIKELKEFFGNAILVAHNAIFDISFLNAAFNDHNLDQINNPWIDTMRLSWALNPDYRNHRLGTIAKKNGIIYDENAHRALYDAEVLAQVFYVLQDKMNNDRDLEDFSIASISRLSKTIKAKPFSSHVTIYARNQKGIKDLYELVSLAHSEWYSKVPKFPKQEILKRKKNLIIGSACASGEIFQYISLAKEKLTKEVIDFYDFFEIQPLDTYSNLVDIGNFTSEELKSILIKIYELGKKHQKLVVATGNVHYIEKLDKQKRDIFVKNKTLGGGRHPLYDFKGRIKSIPNNHFRTTQEMLEDFEEIFNKQIAEELVIKNSNLIASWVEKNYQVLKEGLYSPKIYEKPNDMLKNLVYEATNKKYGSLEKTPSLIKNRIEKELDSITKHGYASIYLISSKIVNNSIANGYLVGSRGSIGSSIVATLTNITEVNPLPPHYLCSHCHITEFDNSVDCGYDLPEKSCPKCKRTFDTDGHNIPFETFLGFEGDKVPDIDLNFAREYQEQAHNFTRELFGQGQVFRAGTISTLARDLAFSYVMTWAEEHNFKEELSRAEVERLIHAIVGAKRTTGQHPGGLIIIPKKYDVYDFTPINHPANDLNEHKTTHFDFHAIHDNLLKLDLLGHLDPSAIKMLVDLTGVDVNDIPKIDKKVIELFKSTKSLDYKQEGVLNEKVGTIAVPEFGTKFVREMLIATKPTSFADLVRISGLSHGTDVWTRNAKDLIDSNKVKLKDVIACRDDIMVYLIEKEIDAFKAFNIMEKVRKGKGLTMEEETLMKKHHVPSWYIDSCNLIKYMFPKAHATAYVLMAWRIAWFKIYYPLEFYAMYFTKRCDIFEWKTMTKGILKIKTRLEEIERKIKNKEPIENKEKQLVTTLEAALELNVRGYKISEIDLKRSKAVEWIIDKENKALIPPFSIIDGMAQTTAEKIITARVEKMFTSIKDFTNRVKINATLKETIIEGKVLKDLVEDDQLRFNFDE